MQALDPMTSRSIVEHLLAEGVAGARERESRTYERLAGPLGTRMVLFGAGGLGRRCLAGLRRYGIEPLAFVDNNSALWGKQIDGAGRAFRGDN